MKLTDIMIRNAKPTSKSYKIADGQGLYLQYFRMKYRIYGKENRLSFGAYLDVTLAEAREKAREARRSLNQEIDPSLARKDQRRKAALHAANTFKAVALEWHGNQEGRWSVKHHQVLHKLETDIFPYLGGDPIADIDAPALLHTLKKIEQRGALDIRRPWNLSLPEAAWNLLPQKNPPGLSATGSAPSFIFASTAMALSRAASAVRTPCIPSAHRFVFLCFMYWR